MSKSGGRSVGKSTFGSIAAGVGTVNIHQRMTISRNVVTRGSIAGDWRVVGRDVKRAVDIVRREFERA